MLILDVPQSGSTGGITSSRNRFGQYRRTRAVPVQPRTPKQTTNRALMTMGSSAWRALAATGQTAWNDYAAQITRSNSLGSGYSPTGQQLYAGACIMATVAVGLPPTGLPNYVLGILNIAYTGPAPGPEALVMTTFATSADNAILVQTSGPVSPGLTSAAAVRRWRTLPNTATNTLPKTYAMTTTSIAILTEFKYLFPSPNTGDVIWFRAREIAYPGGGSAPVTTKSWVTFKLTV